MKTLEPGQELTLDADLILLEFTWRDPQRETAIYAIMLSAGEQLVSKQRVVWRRPGSEVSPDRSVVLREGQGEGARAEFIRSQVFVDLTALPDDVSQVMLVMSVSQKNATLSGTTEISAAVVNTESGDELASMAFGAAGLNRSMKLLTLRRDPWNIEPSGEGLPENLADLATRFLNN